VRRRLKRVEGPGAATPTPAGLWQGGRQVGELRSSAKTESGFVGLAMLSLVNFQPEHALALTLEGAAEIRVVAEACS